MNNLNKSLCGGDGFSHAYIVVHWYFGCINILVQSIFWFKIRNAKNVEISFHEQLDLLCFCMIIFYTCDLHLGLQIFCPMNVNNQMAKWLKKIVHFLVALKKWIL